MVRLSSLLAVLWLPVLFSKGFTVPPQSVTTASTRKISPVPEGCLAPMAAASQSDREDNSTNPTQDWDVDLYQNRHSFVWEYGASLIDVLDPQPDEFILDVGCGSGELTGLIQEKSGGADVVGIDADPDMVEAAIENYPHLDFPCVDASRLIGNQEMAMMVNRRLFDAIFSNAALHWVTDAEAAVEGMAGLLKPGGRFVVEFGGRGNVQTIVEAALDEVRTVHPDAASPWYFPSIAEYSSLLEKHGISVTSAALFDRPTKLEGEDGMKHWLQMFGDGLFRGVQRDEASSPGQKTKEAVIDAVVDRLRSTHLYNDETREWTADYRRIRIVGEKVSPREEQPPSRQPLPKKDDVVADDPEPPSWQ